MWLFVIANVFLFISCCPMGKPKLERSSHRMGSKEAPISGPVGQSKGQWRCQGKSQKMKIIFNLHFKQKGLLIAQWQVGGGGEVAILAIMVYGLV